MDRIRFIMEVNEDIYSEIGARFGNENIIYSESADDYELIGIEERINDEEK